VRSHIDRVFCSTDFEAHFPLCVVNALTRNPSDHAPLVWEDGKNKNKKIIRFRFEK
jgi:endonuclease/exonuclease/phosphatase family metal-dependent hydrolase